MKIRKIKNITVLKILTTQIMNYFIFLKTNYSTSLNFRMLPLYTGTSHLMGRSSIHALRTLRKSFTVYGSEIPRRENQLPCE